MLCFFRCSTYHTVIASNVHEEHYEDKISIQPHLICPPTRKYPSMVLPLTPLSQSLSVLSTAFIATDFFASFFLSPLTLISCIHTVPTPYCKKSNSSELFSYCAILPLIFLPANGLSFDIFHLHNLEISLITFITNHRNCSLTLAVALSVRLDLLDILLIAFVITLFVLL